MVAELSKRGGARRCRVSTGEAGPLAEEKLDPSAAGTVPGRPSALAFAREDSLMACLSLPPLLGLPSSRVWSCPVGGGGDGVAGTVEGGEPPPPPDSPLTGVIIVGRARLMEHAGG